ncbi:histidinol-phosphatase [Roseobacter sp.]|uniref:histidinol-phosphatase n=1 Tax=Roseobacter sp. TaxID=1907202 RepID=UPI00385B8CBD
MISDSRQSPDEILALESIAHLLADSARAAILPYFRRFDLVEDNKLDRGYDPVTQADRAAECAMRAILARERPDDAILGEEYGSKEGQSGLTWVLDPIDGTRGFVSGTPTWGVLIAVSDDQGPFYGMIDQPYIGERFFGTWGRAQMRGPQGQVDLRTRATKALKNAIIFTTFPEVGTAAEGAAFRALAEQTKLTRYGMDCYAYALLAAGQIDLVVEAGLQAYDIQAPIALIEAAGGVVTDWQGRPAHHGGRALAAANADVHAQALAILAEVTP